ncbi:MAG: hypothetical protein HY549_10655 [Elusimicrobia bacterium]|nr:hypothetical protein [Elusimicrobiota bacterium]
MAEEPKDPKKKLPPLPSLGPGKQPPPPLPASGLPAGLPPLPFLPPGPAASSASPPNLPPLPGLPKPQMGVALPPLSPGLPPLHMAPTPAPAPAAPAPPKPDSFEEKQKEYEKKLAELEKSLQSEREKVLMANLKAQEEVATAARVEVSIKELQERLRRDRRDQEQEELRLKLEARLQEMEGKLNTERETWVTTLRNQMQTRETQDKEIESHFALRIQEMERRFLDEKAQWQKLALAKDEEIRTLRTLAEKLKGADLELAKALGDKKWLSERLEELNRERAETQARIQGAMEKEKENVQLRADLTVARQQITAVQDRLEREQRELATLGERLRSESEMEIRRVRAEAEAEHKRSQRELESALGQLKEREERLSAEKDRLQKDLATLSERLRGEHESEMRRIRVEAESDFRKQKDAADRANEELQKVRGVAAALERQLLAARSQAQELQAGRQQWERAQERYKAEFIVLQKRWAEREKEIRAEALKQAMQSVEGEKARLRTAAQEELSARLSKVSEQVQRDQALELSRKETELRDHVERQMADRIRKMQADWDEARRQFEVEIERLHKERLQKEQEWSQRLASRQEEAALEISREKIQLQRELQSSREEVEALGSKLKEAQERLLGLESERQSLLTDKDRLERLCSAQAAQVSQIEQLVEQLRAELARQSHMARYYAQERDATREQGSSPLPPQGGGA